jgi:hypothetical protein
MREGGEVLLELMGRPTGGDEMDFIEIEAPVRGACHAEMATVNRIERAAEERNATRMMFCGGTVRLRGRQYASLDVSTEDFLMNRRLRQSGALNRQL